MKRLGWLLCLCAKAFAQEECEEPVVPEEPVRCEQTFINNVCGPCTPPATPVTNGVHTFVSGDFLYWIAREDGLEYDLLSNTLLPDQVMQGVSVQEPEFEWSPGMRISLGCRRPNDHWELKASWTRLRTHASRSTTVSSGNGLLNNGVWNDGVSIVESADTTEMSARWQLHYNVLDGGIFRSYFLGKNLSAAMAFGVTGLWIHQQLHIFEHNATPATVFYTSIPSEVDLRPEFSSNYNAAGLFFQCSPEWHWNSFVSVLGTLTTRIVHGVFDINQVWKVSQLTLGDLGIEKQLSRTRIGLQGALGLQWQSSPKNTHWHMAVAVQYEGAIWFKQNLFSQVNSSFAENYERRSDLEMQGLSVTTRFDF